VADSRPPTPGPSSPALPATAAFTVRPLAGRRWRGWPADVRLRIWLKVGLRVFGLRAAWAEGKPSAAEGKPSAAEGKPSAAEPPRPIRRRPPADEGPGLFPLPPI
jgi:hypothetical protein